MGTSRQRPSNFRVFTFTLTSALGAVLILGVAAFPPPLKSATTHAASFRKPLVGALYIAICFLGMVAAIFPSKCMSKKLAPKKVSGDVSEEGGVVYELEGTSNCLGIPIHHGHHPGCEQFDPHELIIGRKSLCAGCLGLAIGAGISIGGAFLYFGDLLVPTIVFGPFLLILGTTGNMVMLGRYFLLWQVGGAIRAFLHSAMVVGASFVLIGIDLLTQNLFLDYGTIILVLFWLRTKMLLTKWEHSKVCSVCENPCNEAY